MLLRMIARAVSPQQTLAPPLLYSQERSVLLDLSPRFCTNVQATCRLQMYMKNDGHQDFQEWSKNTRLEPKARYVYGHNDVIQAAVK